MITTYYRKRERASRTYICECTTRTPLPDTMNMIMDAIVFLVMFFYVSMYLFAEPYYPPYTVPVEVIVIFALTGGLGVGIGLSIIVYSLTRYVCPEHQDKTQ